MTDVQQAVPVAQEDREAAATLEAILRDVWDGYSSVHAIREGCADGSSIVQAFARHRLASLPCKSGEGAGEGIPYGSWDTARIKTAIESKLNGLWSWLSSLDGGEVDADEAQKQISLVDGALKNLADIPDATQTREAELVAAITRALECTPSISLPGYLEARIVYDCGDPWEILRAALNARGGA